jgi:hypothetical protein
MNARMAEATRLTRSGRLEEAIALLRGSIPLRAADVSNSPSGNVEQGPVGARAQIIDMIPHSAEGKVRGRHHALRNSSVVRRPSLGRACMISWDA